MYAVWISIGKPKKFRVFEFGGGTGVLARDILQRVLHLYPDFSESVYYTIGERAAGLRKQQAKTISAAGVAKKHWNIKEADAREASLCRPQPGDTDADRTQTDHHSQFRRSRHPYVFKWVTEPTINGSRTAKKKYFLEDKRYNTEAADNHGGDTDAGGIVVSSPQTQNVVVEGSAEDEQQTVFVEGAIISNELLDEFDPIKLKLVWQTGQPPLPNDVRDCTNWREGYVMHRIDMSLVPDQRWVAEANAQACGYLDNPWIQRLIRKHFAAETRCYPYAICCVPMLLALGKVLHFDHKFLERREYNNIHRP